MLRAARVGLKVPGDVTIRVGGLRGVGGGFDGGGISKAVVDVASRKARGEQAEGGQEIAGRIGRGLDVDEVIGRVNLGLGVDRVVG